MVTPMETVDIITESSRRESGASPLRIYPLQTAPRFSTALDFRKSIPRLSDEKHVIFITKY